MAGLLVVGWVSMTPPVKMGRDTYMLTTHARGGFNSNGELLTKVIASANAFCASQGLNALVQSEQNSGVQG